MRIDSPMIRLGSLVLASFAPSFLAAGENASHGPIRIDPEHPAWLRENDGELFYVSGPGDPEDFLYRGRRLPDGTRDGDQDALIQKLIEHGGNSIYLEIVRSHGGDGESDHNPFVDSDPEKGFDEDILAQWDRWFARMDENGILIYLFFFDDGVRLWGKKNDARVPEGERAFVEAIVERFKRYDHLIWIVAEEAEEAFSMERVRAIAQVIRAADDRGHVIGCHHHSGTEFKAFVPGGPLTHFAMQLTAAGDDAHRGAVEAFRAAAGRYQVIYAESTAAKPDVRHAWAAAMGGLMPMMLGMDIATTPVETLERCRALERFFEKSDVFTMAPHDELASGDARWVLADPGRSAIVYGDEVERGLGVRKLAAGHWNLHWLDCESGATRDVDGVEIGDGDSVFARPEGIGRHCAVWVRLREEKETAGAAKDEDAEDKSPTATQATNETAARELRERLGARVFEEKGEVVEVILNGAELSDADLRLLGAFEALRDLSLEKTKLARDGLAALASLEKLEWLNLYRSNARDDDLRALAKLPRIEHISLGETRVTDAGIAHLTGLRTLRYLGLLGTAVTDAGLASVEKLTNLTGLHLGHTDVTDDGLAHLAKLERLEKLWLHDTRITDAAIPHLAKLRGLRELRIWRTSLTIEGVVKLREKLPACTIWYRSERTPE